MKFFILIVSFILPFLGNSQVASGYVLTSDLKPIEGATIRSQEEPQIGTITNEKGYFELQYTSKTEHIISSALTYQTDTFKAKSYQQLILKDLIETTLIIKDQKLGAYNSKTSVEKMEVITAKELTKAACCDLAGCFGTQGAVRVETQNVLTNTKSLSLLGLKSTYNQILIDGMPLNNGLTTIYGLNTLPNTSIRKIFVSKGTASGLQGYEGIAGQINVLTTDYDTSHSVFFNAYVNSFGESQWNLNLNYKLDSFTQGTATLHTTQMHTTMDTDGDGFLDMPKLQRYSFMNKLVFNYNAQKKHQTTFFITGIHEQRLAGQSNYKDTLLTPQFYGIKVNYEEWKSYLKHEFLVSEQWLLKGGLSVFRHQQTSQFGHLNYQGQQENLYLNLQADYQYAEEHKLSMAFNQRLNRLKETVQFQSLDTVRHYNGIYNTNWSIPGVLVENNSVFLEDKLVLLASMRLDYYKGLQWTPRFLVRYIPNEHHVLRASIGTGWRVPTPFSDYNSVLGGNREVLFLETPKVEQALNLGSSYNYEWRVGQHQFSIGLDYYYTQFQNQYVADYYTASKQVLFYNLKNSSYTHVFQTDFSATFNKLLEVKLNYNYTQSLLKLNGVYEEQAFIPKHRILSSISYHLEHWQFDWQGYWTGIQRLPNTTTLPEPYKKGGFSPDYFTMNAQITYKTKRFEVYAGCENLLAFRQLKPLVAWQEPFSSYFDTYSAWGPTRGRELYLGLRWYL